MKKKKSFKKLILSKETISKLVTSEKEAIRGGVMISGQDNCISNGCSVNNICDGGIK